MRFVIFKGEKNVNELVSRIFDLGGRASKATAKQAADALLKANPQLKDPLKIPPGSPIAVPDSAPPLVADEQAAASGLVHSLTSQNVQSAFDAVHQRLAEIETRATNQVNAAMDRVQTEDFKNALANLAEISPELADRLPNLDRIAAGAKAVAADSKSLQKLRKASAAQIQSALASLTKK
jgi:hypothetical protein